MYLWSLVEYKNKVLLNWNTIQCRHMEEFTIMDSNGLKISQPKITNCGGCKIFVILFKQWYDMWNAGKLFIYHGNTICEKCICVYLAPSLGENPWCGEAQMILCKSSGTTTLCWQARQQQLIAMKESSQLCTSINVYFSLLLHQHIFVRSFLLD